MTPPASTPTPPAAPEALLSSGEQRLARWSWAGSWALLLAPAAVGLVRWLAGAGLSALFLPLSHEAERARDLQRGLAQSTVSALQAALLTALLTWPLGAPLWAAQRALRSAGQRIPAWTWAMMVLCGCAPIAFVLITQGLPLVAGLVSAFPAWGLGFAFWRADRARR